MFTAKTTFRPQELTYLANEMLDVQIQTQLERRLVSDLKQTLEAFNKPTTVAPGAAALPSEQASALSANEYASPANPPLSANEYASPANPPGDSEQAIVEQ